MFLPRVPNVACLVFWLKDIVCGIPSCVERNKYIVQTHELKACNAPKGFEPFVQPPSRFLPALSEVDTAESRHRFDYWFSFLCCCPVVMGILCELVRICAKCMAPNSDARIGTARESEGESLTNSTSPLRRLPSKTDSHRFPVVFIMYHIFCASLVTAALCNDWAIIKGGGSFSWELWAIWQQFCLWNLFVQNLLRCWREDPGSLEQKTFMKTMSYTCPVISELADTLKDWIVAGICLKANPGAAGFGLGGIIVVGDFLHRKCVDAPNVFPCNITKSKPMFPLFSTMPILLFYLWAELLNDMFLANASFFLFVCCLVWRRMNDTVISWTVWIVIGLLLCSILQELLSSEDSCSWTCRTSVATHQLLLYVSDGGCLFCLSAYTIVTSHLIVAFDEDSFQDVRRTYRAILSLPKSKPVSLSHLSWQSWISEKASGFAIDFFSTGRLLIAWMEDLPQGLIGLALVVGHRDQVAGIGFAAVSAAIGLAKGVLIPTGQGLVLADRLRRIQAFLADMEELLELLPPAFDNTYFYQELQAIRKAQIEVNEFKQHFERRAMAEEDSQKYREEVLKKPDQLMSQESVKSQWAIFSSAIEQKKNLARQRFGLDRSSSLNTSIHSYINGWMVFTNDLKSLPLRDLEKILKLLEPCCGTDKPPLPPMVWIYHRSARNISNVSLRRGSGSSNFNVPT